MPDRDFEPWAEAIIADIQKHLSPVDGQAAEVVE
jgi:hypothetical protein